MVWHIEIATSKFVTEFMCKIEPGQWFSTRHWFMSKMTLHLNSLECIVIYKDSLAYFLQY